MQQQLSRPRPRAAAATPARALARRAAAAPLPLRARRGPAPARAAEESVAAAAAAEEEEDIDLEDQLEIFMKRQAELESGAAFARTRDPEQIIGGDLVSEEDAKSYCRDIVEFLRTLKASRDMTINEAKLVVAIEDPRARERRQLGIEDDRGVSRDEMASALEEVASGRIPRDRLALKCLYEDMAAWPYLTGADTATAAAAAAATAAAGGGGGVASAAATAAAGGDYASLANGVEPIAKPYILGKEARAGDRPQTLADLLPDWVGYSALYGLSTIPVMLAVGAVLVLFYNSLR
ncbi:hypothetical protein Rsub_12098 [Raphidocelis subcapitata]|uniref:Uncharacterized protein n=1 Tax=Raphidocelis subcapitata TaxID=307507 RepID=A0A2V0PPC9_9CHLO|nr:hypothetical protein Rsub_12098 [Raphidocelis subcapitata]|eukprot:GBF99317.1 hypothetical protein Rsub_12098 [Raphidocelis subcapitata]